MYVLCNKYFEFEINKQLKWKFACVLKFVKEIALNTQSYQYT